MDTAQSETDLNTCFQYICYLTKVEATYFITQGYNTARKFR